ncbi:MAG: HDOD domain-containing protein [Rhodoferax sp.]|uniref:HDOD domain-containing protein n=1 Tax=Rhodoferax sp. TaxID=50421 RepID=UPI00262F3B58|nr:HDOD domain-containing protein [Rhodoferax sp.]MDD2881845.1 HDOD domain-containing protein [Rhodoferax sp.]
MSSATLTRELVIKGSRSLPGFPVVIAEIIAALDDPDGNFDLLVQAISRDPIISARVLSVANTAAMRGTRDAEVFDIAMATALVGVDRVRHITLISSLNTFVAGASRSGMSSSFWQHSVAVGVSCEELARYIVAPVSPAAALVAGLLHDMGQLWLYHFNAQAAQACWREATALAIGVDVLERKYFGVDHSLIGAWLAESWHLPADIVAAIGGHHQPDAALGIALVPLVHVAEVLSNALDLADRADNRVTHLSSAACEKLGLVWNDDSRALFGRMESRSRHANAFFATPSLI